MASPAPELTPRQQQILTMIREWVDRHGYPPTMREIAREVDALIGERGLANCHRKQIGRASCRERV